MRQPGGRNNRSPARECWGHVPFNSRVPSGTTPSSSIPTKPACRPAGLVARNDTIPGLTSWVKIVSPFRLRRSHPSGCLHCLTVRDSVLVDSARSLKSVIGNTAPNKPRNNTDYMSHSYSLTLFHVVFSTKERRAAIAEPAKLWAYVAGIARNIGYEPLAIGGTGNHVHMLLRLPAHIPISEATQKLKSNSSRWLGENGSWPGWQQGYGAFSVSPSNVDVVRHYIQNQTKHHRRRSFEEEFLALLMKSGIEFDKADVFE
jgi:putative transposase